MGSWGCGINTNDIAEDLKPEYAVAFSCWEDINEALARIDRAARIEYKLNEDDEEWVDYRYSLADYMWKNGILTPAVKDEVLGMIRNGIGLDIWEEEKKEREKVLEKFRRKIESPMPPKKKIKIPCNGKSIFEPGDVIAVPLNTHNTKEIKSISEEEKVYYDKMDGKYILIRKIRDRVCWKSAVNPQIKDISPIFQLYDFFSDTIPDISIMPQLTYAVPREEKRGVIAEHFHKGLFDVDSIQRLKKKECKKIGVYLEGIEQLSKIDYAAHKRPGTGIFLLSYVDTDREIINGLTIAP